MTLLSKCCGKEVIFGYDEAEARHKDEISASELLWKRLDGWREDWQKAHPKQELLWPDTLALIEWKHKSEMEKLIKDMETLSSGYFDGNELRTKYLNQ